jgi:hypothetical protein
LNHIEPLTKDAHGNEYILVIIDAFSRWVELFPTKSTTALETASVMLNHIGRFGNDPGITDYPVNSYILYTPPMGRSNKLLPKHKGPYQVRGRKQSIYIIEDLVQGSLSRPMFTICDPSLQS